MSHLSRIRLVLATLLLTLADSGRLAAAAPGLTADVPADPMLLLPPEARHEFAPVEPTWIKRTEEMYPNASGRATRGAEPGKAQQGVTVVGWTDTYWQPGAGGAPAREVKRLVFDTLNRICRELESTPSATWERGLFPDGALGRYQFTGSSRPAGGPPGEKVMAFSVRPDRKLASVYLGGDGELIAWDGRGGVTRTLFCAESGPYLRIFFENGLCREVTFTVPQVQLVALDGHETLTLEARQEKWATDPGVAHFITVSATREGRPVEVPRPPPDETAARILPVVGNFIGPAPSREERRRMETAAAERFAADYPLRREEAMAALDAILRREGKTWEGLGLAAWRKTPWKDLTRGQLPQPDPKWLVSAGRAVESPDNPSALAIAETLGAYAHAPLQPRPARPRPTTAPP